MSDVFDLFGDLDPQPEPAPVQPPSRKAKARASAPTPAPPPEPSPPPTPKVNVDADPVTEPVGEFGPRFFDCGHLNWYRDEANETARAEGFCCEGGRKKIVASYTRLRGQYVRPLPPNARRTVERERSMGYPGYCCDADGWYIGGVGNDCRYYSPDARRCVVHGAPPTPIVYDDEEPADAAPVDETPPPQEPTPMPKATGSWKQRQMSAKRGRR